MPRKPRNYSVNNSYHIYLCAHEKQSCFIDHADYQYYLGLLHRASLKYHVSVHAFALIANHIQLLVTTTTNDGISKLMQSISSSYVRYFNKKHQTKGPLFKGRYKACVVETKRFLLACMRYIEEQAIKANNIKYIKTHAWSSYVVNAANTSAEHTRIDNTAKTKAKAKENIKDGQTKKEGDMTQQILKHNNISALIKPHKIYLDLGFNTCERQKRYQQLFNCERRKGLAEFIKERIIYNFPIASQVFIDELEQTFAIDFYQIKPGRPKKSMRLNIPIIYC